MPELSCAGLQNGRFYPVVAALTATRALDWRGRTVTGKAAMSFASIFDGVPAWVLVPCAFLLIVAALRYRGAVAIVVTGLCLFGLWNAGDPHPWLAFPFGLLIYGVLSAIASFFGRAIGEDAGGEGGGYDHAAEQARLANEYHRREREGRF